MRYESSLFVMFYVTHAHNPRTKALISFVIFSGVSMELSRAANNNLHSHCINQGFNILYLDQIVINM